MSSIQRKSNLRERAVLKAKREYCQEMRRIKEQAQLEREYQLIQAKKQRRRLDYFHSQQFEDDLRSVLLQGFQGLVFIPPTKPDLEQVQPPDLTPTEIARPEEAKKLVLDQFGSRSEPSLKQAEEYAETESETTTLSLKQEEEVQDEYDHVPDQEKEERRVLGGSPKATELVLSIVEQGDSFKTSSFELQIRPMVCLQFSFVEHLRVFQGLQQVVFEPGGSFSLSTRSNNNMVQKTVLDKLDLQGFFTPEEQDLRSNLFEGRENGVILSNCSKHRGGIGGNTSLIRFITDQDRLRGEIQKLVVVKEKPELEDEYGDQTTRPPDQKEIKLRVYGLMFMNRMCVGSSWREAAIFKLNKLEESSALEATYLEKSSKMLLRHEEGLQSFVFDPGDIGDVRISFKAISCTLVLSDQGYFILQSLDLRSNPFKGGEDGVAMTRDQGEESSESEEEGSNDETALEEELEADVAEEGQTPKEPFKEGHGPMTRSRLRAQEESLQALIQFVIDAQEKEAQAQEVKPACWFNLIMF